jgi:glutathione synthase/RimK-type ligase-like ATP-grasp enzyme
MNNLLILTDYRNQFWLKTDYKEQSVDLDKLKAEILRIGYNAEIKKFADIDFRNDDYKDWYIFYQSSQDPDLLYKSYIEDILIGLKLQGAKLLPDYQYLRAHHNKVFMEILRETCGTENMKLIKSWYFGTYEEFIQKKKPDTNQKFVFKLSTGDQSKNVALLDSRNKFLNIPKRQSRSFDWYYWFIDQIKPYWKSRYPGYRKKSHHRRKFIIQEFIPNLTGDYKILVFTDKKIFVLARETRTDDFRASGSGRFTFIQNVSEELLEFSLEVFNVFSVPFISLDIAVSGDKFYLLEFQFVSFGTYTVEKSLFHFEKTSEKWELVDGMLNIETEYAEALDWFIKNRIPGD